VCFSSFSCGQGSAVLLAWATCCRSGRGLAMWRLEDLRPSCGGAHPAAACDVGHNQPPSIPIPWSTFNALSFLPLPEKTELLVNIRSARDQFICSSNRSFCSPINEASFFAETWLGAVPGAASKPAACCGALLLYSHLS
jgi:hypothetical protein